MASTRPAPRAPEPAAAAGSAAAPEEVKPAEVLVLNRDPELRTFLSRALYIAQCSSTSVSTPDEARACLQGREVALLLVAIEDTISPELASFIREVREGWPKVPVLAVAPRPPGELVREAMLLGVRDFLLDPLHTQSVSSRLKEVLAEVTAAAPAAPPAAGDGASPAAEAPPPAERERGRERRTASVPFIVTRNPRMKRVLEIADTIAPTDSTVLILGESGTGKEVLARRIHQKSLRSEQPFVEVNCGAIPESLLESQLFGHEKGSFTGAVHRQVGLFEIAHRGTIFLDEIGEMGLDMQVKLLRVLQNQEFRRIGGSQTLKVDVRVIAATNHDLKADVDSKVFRPDLYYRLNVICLEIPPLRERLEEVPDLVEVFQNRLEERGLPRKTFHPDAVARLQKCRWLGNVRELENVVERLILLSQGSTVSLADVDEHLEDNTPQESPFAPTLTLDEVKRMHIASVLKQHGGNKMRTARLLGINVKTLYNLIKSLNIALE